MKHLLVNESRPSAIGYEPRHARCYCVAIAGTVATIGATAYSAYSASQAGGDSGGGGGAGSAALYGSKVKVPDYENNVNIPSYSGQQGAGDYLAMLPYLNQISMRVTNAGNRAREIASPGSGALMSSANANLLAMSRGQVGKDVVDVTNQIAAERTGGGIDPSDPRSYAGSGSQGATTFARDIGRSSQQNVNDFLSAAPAWEQLANSFAYTPDEAAAGAMDMLRIRNSYVLGAGELQKGIDENMYTAALNKARGAAAPNPQAVGARNDALLQQSMQNISGSGPSNYLTSINGIVSGLGGLANASGGGLNKSTGFYNTQAAAGKAGGTGAITSSAGPNQWYISGYGG